MTSVTAGGQLLLALALGTGPTLYAMRGVHRFWLGHRSRSWPRAPGRVLEATEVRSVGFRGARFRAAHVEYRYKVAGATYRGRTVRWTDLIDGESHAAQTVSAYPRGREVVIAYDPRDPRRAVLEPGVTWGAAAWLSAWLLLTLAWWWVLARVV